MSLAHRDLQTFSTPLVLRQRKFSANWSRALILGTLVFATLNSSWAQDAGAVTTGKPNPIYPDEWRMRETKAHRPKRRTRSGIWSLKF